MRVILRANCPVTYYMFKFYAHCIFMHNHDPVQLVEFCIEDYGRIAPLLLIIARTVMGTGYSRKAHDSSGSISHCPTFKPVLSVL